MSDVPKCTSIWGHKFEARYSKGPAVGHGKISLGYAESEAVCDVLEAYRQVTYEADICVRCGHVVERKPTQSSTHPTT